MYRGVGWSWCQGRGKWWCWCWVGRCWCWGGGCWGGRPMRPERRHTLCASLSSRNAFQHVTRAAPYGNLQVTRRRPEWGAPRSGTCLYTYRKNPSVWTNCLGNQKTDCNCLPACHFWTSGLVAGPGTRAPGHNPDPRAHGHNPDPRAHGHTGKAHQRTNLPFCTLVVRCLHAFKFAGTHRFTTAAMNILGLRIKTARSNFEMFGHVLDNSLSFMLYFLKNMLHKLVAHFAEVIRPPSQTLLHHRWNLL